MSLAVLLVLDDEPQILTSLHDLFEDDYEVLTATDATTALRLARERDAAVVMTDERMPGLSGHEFLQQLQQVSQATRVMISGYADMAALTHAVNCGRIYAYVAKPWNPLELKATIHSAYRDFQVKRDLEHERESLRVLNRRMEAEIRVRKAAEDEVRRLNAELEHRVIERTEQLADAVKQLEAFSYCVSHDLKAPLRAINGYSTFLMEECGPSLEGKARHYLESIAAGAKTMGQLIDDLLAFSRLGRKGMATAEVNMEELARSVFEELERTVQERKLECKVLFLPQARGDQAMIRQVLVNLLTNAIKFTRLKDPALIEVGSTANGPDQNSYYVKDNGAGFNMKYIDKLFGVFQRLHSTKEFEGTGVGLAIVQRIVQRHGGHVSAEGKVNEGAIFRFTLPAGHGSA